MCIDKHYIERLEGIVQTALKHVWLYRFRSLHQNGEWHGFSLRVVYVWFTYGVVMYV
jgi:hypothetical protein